MLGGDLCSLLKVIPKVYGRKKNLRKIGNIGCMYYDGSDRLDLNARPGHWADLFFHEI